MLHIRIILNTKFQFKLTILNFWIKFDQAFPNLIHALSYIFTMNDSSSERHISTNFSIPETIVSFEDIDFFLSFLLVHLFQ